MARPQDLPPEERSLTALCRELFRHRAALARERGDQEEAARCKSSAAALPSRAVRRKFGGYWGDV